MPLPSNYQKVSGTIRFQHVETLLMLLLGHIAFGWQGYPPLGRNRGGRFRTFKVNGLQVVGSCTPPYK